MAWKRPERNYNRVRLLEVISTLNANVVPAEHIAALHVARSALETRRGVLNALGVMDWLVLEGSCYISDLAMRVSSELAKKVVKN